MVKRTHRIIKSHHRALKIISNAKRHNLDVALKNAPSLAKAIKLLFQYILNGNLEIKSHHVRKLKPHKNYIRRIAYGRRGESVVQKGGSILGTILEIVVPLIKNIL